MNKLQKIAKARTMGCKMPIRAYKAHQITGVPFWFICAILEQETSGGENVFGQDPTIFVRAGKVTEAKYKAYKAMRKATGKMQGVGPMQLTWYSFQDMADAQGGCWRPQVNIITGAQVLKGWKTKTNTWVDTTARWNSGREYQREIRVVCKKWHSAFLNTK